MARMARRFIQYRWLFLIVAIGFTLRVTRLQDWFQFEMDEEVIAWKTRQFWQNGKPFLIGGGTPYGFHLGPVFYYLSSLPLFITSGDPIGWGWLAALVSISTLYLLWVVGKSLYARRVGLIAALLWATSFVSVMSDRHWWPLVLDPALSLLVIYVLFNILNNGIATETRNGSPRKDAKWWGVLGLTLGFGWQADLTVLPLFLVSAVVAALSFRRQWKGILLAGVILLTSSLPLVMFEMRHPGANAIKLRSDLIGSDLRGSDLFRAAVFVPETLGKLLFPIAHVDGNLLRFYTWCQEVADSRVDDQPWWAVGVAVFLLSIPFFGLRGRAADKVLRLMIISSVAGILVFKMVGGNLYDFYLAVLYPVVILLAAKSIDFIWRTWGILIAGVVVITVVGLNVSAIARANHPQSLALKREAVQWVVENTGGKDFALESISSCSRYNGVRYLFFLAGKEPIVSFMDPNYFWLYDKLPLTGSPHSLVVFVTPEDLTSNQRTQYNELQKHAIARQIFGAFDVFVVNNETHQFSIDFQH